MAGSAIHDIDLPAGQRRLDAAAALAAFFGRRVEEIVLIESLADRPDRC